MQRLHFRETPVVSACLLASIGLALAACSSGGSGNGQSTTPTAPATSSPPSATGSGAVAAIKANYATFFNGKAPLSREIALLQDGPKLRAAITANRSNSLAS